MQNNISVDKVWQVYGDENHNAFTDLVWFKDRIYLTFRNCPDGHPVFSSSRIFVLSSDDGQSWQREFDFSVDERDVRDPHFLVFNDTLFVYTGTWLVEKNRDINHHLGYGVWTRDGDNWNGPQLLEGTYGHYIWRAASTAGKAYLCGRRKKEFVQTATHGDGVDITESAILESDDGLVWQHLGLFQADDGNETAFIFESDGSALAIARGGKDQTAQVCRSSLPYDSWSRKYLDQNIGGPMLSKWGEDYIVGGRKYHQGGEHTAIWKLVDDHLEEIAVLPSGGDTSYPGFVPLSDSEALLSYYSSHEGTGVKLGPSSIYIAKLVR